MILEPARGHNKSRFSITAKSRSKVRIRYLSSADSYQG
jgi:hypothetical protein